MIALFFQLRAFTGKFFLWGTPCFAVAFDLAARQQQLLDASCQPHLNEADGNSSVAPPNVPVTQWVWVADNNATNLDTASWRQVTNWFQSSKGLLGLTMPAANNEQQFFRPGLPQ